MGFLCLAYGDSTEVEELEKMQSDELEGRDLRHFELVTVGNLIESTVGLGGFDENMRIGHNWMPMILDGVYKRHVEGFEKYLSSDSPWTFFLLMLSCFHDKP